MEEKYFSKLDTFGYTEIPVPILKNLQIQNGDILEIIQKNNTIHIKKHNETKHWYIDAMRNTVNFSEGLYPSAIGNAFATNEEASWALEHLKLIHEMKQWVNENDNHFKPDWNNTEQSKWCLVIQPACTLSYKILCHCCDDMDIGAPVYFSSYEKAIQAIKDFGEDRIFEYYF